jgi:hypothetical protein
MSNRLMEERTTPHWCTIRPQKHKSRACALKRHLCRSGTPEIKVPGTQNYDDVSGNGLMST